MKYYTYAHGKSTEELYTGSANPCSLNLISNDEQEKQRGKERGKIKVPIKCDEDKWESDGWYIYTHSVE